MAELKTTQTGASVEKFLASIVDDTRRADAVAVCALMQQVSQQVPRMWGSAIIGFGSRRLVYESGRELDWMMIGFSPRKQNTVLYVLNGFPGQDELLAELGKHKTGKGCLYIKSLADVDRKVLKEIAKQSAAFTKKT